MKLGLSRNLTLPPEAAAKSIFLQLPQIICLHWGTFPVTQKLHKGSWKECTSYWEYKAQRSSQSIAVSSSLSPDHPPSSQVLSALFQTELGPAFSHPWLGGELAHLQSLTSVCCSHVSSHPPALNIQLFTVLPQHALAADEIQFCVSF